MKSPEPHLSLSADQPLSLDDARDLVAAIEREIHRVVIGQQTAIDQVLLVLLAGGHGLLQGVPGLAKTLLVKTLARALHLRFSRIQFTPDLMPADVLGSEVIEEDRVTGHRSVRFLPGPIFAQVILADEINRTPPRTQAALLEAMQESQVTVAGVRYPLEPPVFVLATENPIEQEGTYPLPEAQLDRFMLNIVMDYPTAAEERAVVAATTTEVEPVVNAVATAADLLRLRRLVREVPAADNVVDFATRIVRATRPGGDGPAVDSVSRWVRWGAGPRAGQALVLAAKARAVRHGRPAVSLEDVHAVARPVLRHRVLVNFHALADAVTPDRVVTDVLDAVPMRR